MAERMLASVEQEPAPARLVLGSDAFAAIVRALKQRLADVEPQQASAASTDFA